MGIYHVLYYVIYILYPHSIPIVSAYSVACWSPVAMTRSHLRKPKSWRPHQTSWKTMATTGKTMGKPWENHGKNGKTTRKAHGFCNLGSNCEDLSDWKPPVMPPMSLWKDLVRKIGRPNTPNLRVKRCEKMWKATVNPIHGEKSMHQYNLMDCRTSNWRRAHQKDVHKDSQSDAGRNRSVCDTQMFKVSVQKTSENCPLASGSAGRPLPKASCQNRQIL